MKRTKYYLSVLVISLSLSSCITKGSVVRADELSGEDFINIDIDDAAKPIDQTAAQAANPNKVTSQRHHSERSKPAASVSDINGQWVIIEAGQFQISQDNDMPYLIFSDTDGRFYASNGCNVLNGNFKYHDKSISFSNVLSTMMLCSDIGYEAEINSVLRDGSTVKAKIEKINNESYLTFYDHSGNFLMRLRSHNLEVINGQWEVAEIDDEEVDGEEVNVFFDIPQLTIHGNTGCNFFNGKIIIDPNVSSAISFSQMGVTQRACPNHEIERSMLVGLEQTYTYELKGGNTLLLKDSDDNVLIKLQRPR